MKIVLPDKIQLTEVALEKICSLGDVTIYNDTI